MRSRLFAFLLVPSMVAALCAPAMAARVTVSCAVVSSTDEATKYVLANRFVFDSDAQSLDMQVRNSRSNWLFVTQKSEFIDDVFSVRFGEDGTISAAGLRNSVPVAFRLNPDGSLDFSYLTDKAPERIRFDCSAPPAVQARGVG